MLGLSVPMAFADDEDLNEETMNAKSGKEYKQAVKKLSPEVRKERSDRRISYMVKSKKDIYNLKEEKRKEGESIQLLNCINDKYTLIGGHVNLSKSSYVKMMEANDPNTIAHNYTIIAVSYQKVRQLVEDAYLCVGEQGNVSENSDASISESEDIVPIEPVLPGGYTQLEDIFGDIYDTTGLTPLR